MLNIENLKISRCSKNPGELIATFKNKEILRWTANKETSEKDVILQGVKLGLKIYELENINQNYYVLTDGDKPNQLIFDQDEAFNSNSLYIYVFDYMGNLIKSYKLINDEYIDNF